VTAAGATDLTAFRRRATGGRASRFSASDPETSAALRQTIESKMKTAGVLGDFLTGLFTFAANDIGAALMTVNGARPPSHSIAKASCVSGGLPI